MTTTRTPDSTSSSAETRSRSVWSITAMSSGPSRRTSRPSSACRGVPGRCARSGSSSHRSVEMNSLPPSIRSSSSRRWASSSGSIRVCVGRRAPSRPVVRLGDARDLRQVRDRQDRQCALGEALQRRRDRVGSLAADPGVDLVEDHRRPPPHPPRRSQARRGRARPRGRLGDGAERQACVRTDQEDCFVCAGRARVAVAQLDPELALAHADAAQLLGDGVGERVGRGFAGGAKLGREPLPAPPPRSASPRPQPDRGPSSSAASSPAPRLRARAGRRSPSRRSGGVHPRSAPARPRRARAGRARLRARRGSRAGRSRPRAAAARRPPAPRPRARGARAARAERAQRSAVAASPVAPSPSSGASASAARAAPSARLGDVAEPLPLVAQRLLIVRLETRGRLHERLGSRRRASSAAAPRVSSSCRLRAAASSRQASRAARRRGSCTSPTNESRTSSWYDGRPSRRCSNWPDIAISRSAAAARSSRATARPHA